MPKLVYIYGDDHKCLETLISSMRSNGYSLEYTSLPDEPAAGAIRADIVLICKPAVWGFQDDSTTRVADDTVKRLRKKLVGSGVGIETIWGYGFKLREMPAAGSAV